MANNASKSDDKYIIPSLLSAGEVLKYLSSYRTKKSSLTEISKNLGINKSTCYRLLHTLTEMKMIVYDADTKLFSLGPQLMVLGKRAEEFIDFIPIAKEYLKEAVNLTNSTCALVQKIENDWVYLVKEEPSSAVRVTINVGQRFKIPNGATGKLFLAYMDYSDQQKFLKQLPEQKNVNKPILDVELFEKELIEIRERGYSFSLEEHYPGIDGVSAPIIERSGGVQMAITAILIHTEQSQENVMKIGEYLKRITTEFSQKIFF